MIEKTPPYLVNDLFQLMKQFPKIKLQLASSHGLTRSEAELLFILTINLDEKHVALSVSDLSRLLQITPAGVTHLLNPLEEAGCIERLRDPNDRRVVLIGLTDHGREIAEKLIAEFQEKMIGLMDYLGDEDSKNLIRLMSRTITYFINQSEN
ncbi:MAG: MarR family transcriptional regulator [Chloroflexota bacterium]